MIMRNQPNSFDNKPINQSRSAVSAALRLLLYLEVKQVPYIHFTEEQKLRASEVDLVEFLRCQGEKLIPSG